MVAVELVAEGPPSVIKSGQGGHLLELRVNEPQRAADLLKAAFDRWRVSLFGERLHVVVDELTSGRQTIDAVLTPAGVEVLQARESRFSLEDVFIRVVEQARLQGKVAAED